MLFSFGVILTLAGCFETPEEREARQTQFNGKTLQEVEARIGEAYKRTSQQAIWKHSYTSRQAVPIYAYLNGQQTVVGYRYQTVTHSCTFTALLKGRKIVSSDYQGNDCRRYAPKLEA